MARQKQGAEKRATLPPPSGFELTSPDVNDGRLDIKHILSKSYGFGCAGGNVSPRLCWRGAPAGTMSFVLTLHDLDAPTGIGWMHWVVVNIPASVAELPQGVSAG